MSHSYRPLTPHRRLTPSIVIQVIFGIVIGLLLGVCLNQDSEADVEDHIRKMSHDEVPSAEKLFYLRCIVMITPTTKKPERFMASVKDGWGSLCNQTIFYTTDAKLQEKSKDQFVIYVESKETGFEWDYYRSVLEHANKMPAAWTLVGDEQLFVLVNNLRKVLSEMNDDGAVMVGRVRQAVSVASWFFPFAYGNRINHQAGVVMSQKAVKAVIACNGYFFPHSSEKSLLECAKTSGITVVDPVDEEGQHLFHVKGMMSLIPDSFTNKTANIKEAEGVAGCCSDHSITFGSTSYKEMRVAHYATQKVTVFGSTGMERFTPTTTTKTTPKPTTKTVKKATASKKPVEKKKTDTKPVSTTAKSKNEKR